MKRFIAVAAVGLAAVGLYAAVAPAGQQSVTPRQFSALSKKVTTLSKTVTNLKKELAGVETCALSHAVSIAQFGAPPTEGRASSTAARRRSRHSGPISSAPSSRSSVSLRSSPPA